MKSFIQQLTLLAGFALATLSVTAQAAPKPDKPIALVYAGPGSCSEACSNAAALQAEHVGLQVVFVGPQESDLSIFKNAVVWIQPGGKSSVVSKNMTAELKQAIRDFVAQGGAYVGFCAGGFFATEYIRDKEAIGLGLLPGKSFLYAGVSDSPVILPLTWNGVLRDIYWEGGPYFTATEKEGVEILATYPDGSAATLRTHYGKGRVAVTGAHPEAPPQWREGLAIPDTDGLDYELAEDMIRWSIQKK